jgi:hypothetical protein
LNRLKEELAVLEIELEKSAGVADAARQPEVAQASALIEEARAAVASAFLSRRAMILARESLTRAAGAVHRASAVSALLRQRSTGLRRQADELCAEAARSLAATAMKRVPREARATGRAGAASQVQVESGIPEDHPEKAAIEAAVHELMSAHSGEWHVWITVPPGSPWWGLRVHGVGFDWVGTLQDESEQTPEFVRARLEPLIRAAAKEVALRRRRVARRRDPEDEAPPD